MNSNRYLTVSFILLALLTGGAPLAAQAQTRIAVEKRIQLSRGRTRTIRGKADSTTSYVYKLRARKDQTLEARVTSEGGAASFSIVPPGTQILDNAAGVSQWSGALPEDGEYFIIVTISTSGEAEIPYTLELTMK